MGIDKKYTKALVIVHGKSELQICKYIKQNLRLPIEIKSDKNGEKSIQVTSIMNTLNDTQHKNLKAFFATYPGINISGKGKSAVIKDFKIFIILDLDDCTCTQASKFIDKSMFKGHWAYDYIIPIYNDKNLEDALQECGVKYEKKRAGDKKKEYVKIFPTDKKYAQKNDRLQISEFADMIKKSKKTNMYLLVDYCMKI